MRSPTKARPGYRFTLGAGSLMSRATSLLALVLTLLLIAGCTQPAADTPTPTSAPSPSATPGPASPTPMPSPMPELPRVASAFTIEGTPFRFLGGFVPGWHWGLSTEVSQKDLIATAKENGISVLHVMLPPIERQLGLYDDKWLPKLDLFLDQASRSGIYVMIELMQGWWIAMDQNDAYYHPGGIEGLVKEPRIKDAYKKRLEHVIMRRNTVNGKTYRDDSTILAWIMVMEPISAPFNYPIRPPKVTALELRDWFEEMALYTKSLDPNHLVTVGTTAAIDSLEDWLVAFGAPALDFIYAEDAEARILQLIKGHGPEPYPLRLFHLGKPVVIMLSFTSGVWDLERIGKDYVWQANTLRDEAVKYFEAGAGGVIVFSWGSALYEKTGIPQTDLPLNYNATNEPIIAALTEIATEFRTTDWPRVP